MTLLILYERYLQAPSATPPVTQELGALCVREPPLPDGVTDFDVSLVHAFDPLDHSVLGSGIFSDGWGVVWHLPPGEVDAGWSPPGEHPIRAMVTAGQCTLVSGLELSVVTDQRLVVLAPGEWPTPDPAPKVGLLLVQGDGISWDEARARCGRRSFRPAWTTPRSAAWTELPEHCAPRLDIAGHRGPKIQRLGVWFWEPGAAAVTSDPLGREVPLGKAR